ncbi:MAG: hypothetical protein M3362_19500 [Acidobacteriota bacterium]|nr:hypothetical protein [Acidobacteriota bacterium]
MINLPSGPAGSNVEVQNGFNRTTLSWRNPTVRVVSYSIFLAVTLLSV